MLYTTTSFGKFSSLMNEICKWSNLKPQTQVDKFCESGGLQDFKLKGEDETFTHQAAFYLPSKVFRFWCRGFCHRTGSDLLLFVLKIPANVLLNIPL